MNLRELLESYITDNEIYIDKENWKKLKETYDKNEVRDVLSDIIIEGKIKLPLVKISYNDAVTDFKKLQNQKYDIQDGDVYSRFKYKYSISKYFLSASAIGGMASNYFQQYNRYCASTRLLPSPVDGWKDKKYVYGLTNALWTLKGDVVDQDELRACIRLQKYTATQFKPVMAKFIYDIFNAKDVLDISSGWGDRLCGFYSSNAKSYFGIDPNTVVYNTYFKQIELYEQFVHKDVHIENLPAEEVDFKDRMFDTVFTSPPYFCSEHYSDEDTQSWKRYDTLDKWLNNFLYVVLKNVWDHLKEDGYLILNISDIYHNKERISMCDPMNDFISKLENAQYVGELGMKMSKRPGSLADKDEGSFVEPMWIWKKSSKECKLEDLIKKETLEDW